MYSKDLVKDYLDYRCSIYFCLKSLYITEPNESIVNDIIDACIDNKDKECMEYEKNFISFFADLDKESINNLCKDVRVEYARLFLGPRHVVAPPYESVYTSGSKSIFGEASMEVKELYERVGVKIENKANIPYDFIGYELEFIYYLSFKALEAIDKDDRELFNEILSYSNYFIKEHTAKWINKFTKDIEENTTMDFFKVVAKFTREFVLSDCKMIDELLK